MKSRAYYYVTQEGKSPSILYLTERFIMSQSMGYNSVQYRDSEDSEAALLPIPKTEYCVLSVGLFGDGADVEIAVATVFVMLVTTI